MEAESVPIEGSLETSHLLEQVKINSLFSFTLADTPE